MRYTELIEKSSTQQDEVSLTIRKECSDYFNKVVAGGRLIFRGIDSAYIDFRRFDTTIRPRISANTSNYYTMLTTILPSWAGWPARNRSMICASSEEIASQYGDVYIVFPSNQCVLGIAPSDDFWSSFRRISEVGCNPNYLDEFNEKLYSVLNKLTELEGGKAHSELIRFHRSSEQSNIDEFKKSLGYFEELGQKHINLLPEDLRKFFKINNSLMDTINWILDPIENGHTMGNPRNNLPMNREIWVSGVVYLVSREQLMKSMPDFYNLVKHQF